VRPRTRGGLIKIYFGRLRVKPIVKALSSRITVRTYERAMTYALLREEFPETQTLREYPDKPAIWSAAIEAAGGREAPITYVEFGVYDATGSFRYFLENNTNPSSIFIGLDSFHGLPERFGKVGAGYFDLGGVVPKVEDPRATLIEGWFKDTWDELYARIAGRDRLLVHYDADIYSSTLFALARMELLRKPYIALFDEFTGPETLAAYNYRQAFGAKLEMMGKITVHGYAEQVLCRIVPHGC
jgi:hypothetical protein